MTERDLDLADALMVLRIAAIRRQEVERAELRWWYLSFADDTGFLGAVVVEAFGITDALHQAHLRKINPGGDVRGLPWPADVGLPAPSERNRLLAAEEAFTLASEAATGAPST